MEWIVFWLFMAGVSSAVDFLVLKIKNPKVSEKQELLSILHRIKQDLI